MTAVCVKIKWVVTDVKEEIVENSVQDCTTSIYHIPVRMGGRRGTRRGRSRSGRDTGLYLRIAALLIGDI